MTMMMIRDANNSTMWIQILQIRIDRKRAIRPLLRLETHQEWLFVAAALFVETSVEAFVGAFDVQVGPGSQSA
jgi:hypothetical protein